MLQSRNAAANEARGVPELTQLGGTGIRGNSLPTKKAQAIFAELIGSNTCMAAGITVVDHAPVLALCRSLVTVGHDLNRPLHAYRGDVLCLRVRSIGEGARLTVEDDRRGRPRLRRWRNRGERYGAAPLVRQIGDAATSVPPRAVATGGAAS
jgi:hypothetical protein